MDRISIFVRIVLLHHRAKIIRSIFSIWSSCWRWLWAIYMQWHWVPSSSPVAIFSQLELEPFFFFASKNCNGQSLRQIKRIWICNLCIRRRSRESHCWDEWKGKPHVFISPFDSFKLLNSKLVGNWWQALNGRVIFVDYAKPNTSLGGGMPVARGPQEPTANKWLLIRGCYLRRTFYQLIANNQCFVAIGDVCYNWSTTQH